MNKVIRNSGSLLIEDNVKLYEFSTEELVHFFWVCAEQMGMIDGVGGCEWLGRHNDDSLLVSDEWVAENSELKFHNEVFKEVVETVVKG